MDKECKQGLIPYKSSLKENGVRWKKDK